MIAAELSAEQAAWREALRIVHGAKVDDKFAKYRDDPVGFGRDVLGATYWAAQVSTLTALARKRRVTIRGPRKSSKTHTAAHAVCWFMSTAPSRVVTIGASWNQVQNQLWNRIGSEKSGSRVELPGDCRTVQWKVAPDWYAIGMATDKPVNARGFHSDIDAELLLDPAERIEQEVRRASERPKRRLFILIDEANGVDPNVIHALQGSMQGEDVYVMMQANPVLPADDPHPYARSHQPGSGYHRIHISAEKIEDDEVGSDELFDSVPEALIRPEWIAEMRRDYGEKHPIFLGDVRGQFSSAAVEWQIITRSMLVGTQELELPDDGKVESRHIGVDIAREGGDRCVAALAIGGTLSAVHTWRTKGDLSSLMTTAGVIVQLMRQWGVDGLEIPARNTHIDATGLGAGVVDRLRQIGYYVDAVDFGAGAKYASRRLTGQAIFANTKSELFWTLRRALEEREACIPAKYAEVWRQLQWHRYKLAERSGGTAIAMRESKDEIIKKHGESPDFADACVLAWSRGASVVPGFRVL